jgi:GNAT superfamily N-acetyltransferase
VSHWPDLLFLLNPLINHTPIRTHSSKTIYQKKQSTKMNTSSEIINIYKQRVQIPQSQLNFRLFADNDAQDLTTLVNDAFSVDKFFKYPEYYDRVSVESILGGKNDENFIYVLGTETLINNDDETQKKEELSSCVLSNWYIEIKNVNPDDDDNQTLLLTIGDFLNKFEQTDIFTKFSQNDQNNNKYSLTLISSISQVSVSPSKQGKGLGKQLIAGAELFLVEYAAQKLLPKIQHVLEKNQILDQFVHFEHISRLEVLVSVRPELLPFYSKLGYTITRENVPFSAKFICLPGYDFCSTTMEKPLVVWTKTE